MLTLQDPKEVCVGEGNHNAMSPEDENVVSIIESEVKHMDSKTPSFESEVKDMEGDDIEDFDHRVSSGRRKMIILSDDEDSNPPNASVRNLLLENEEDSVGQGKHIIRSDSESEDGGLFNKELSIPKPKFAYNPDLFDTELSDEDQPTGSDEVPLSTLVPQESEKPIPQKDKKKASKSRQSSVRAQQEIREIHSESQRLVRESRVSLPYHRPKQRTLAEFLARRKQTMPPKIERQSLKMSMRNMEALKLLEEKKKQAEEFYKSDSDGEDPDDLDWTPEKKEAAVAEEEMNSSTTAEKKDEQTETAKQLSLCTATEGKDEPVGTEEEQSSCVAIDLVSDDTLPDLVAPLIESSTQNMEPQESCSESLLLTNHAAISSEDEGIGTSEKNAQNDLSTSVNTAPSTDTAAKQDSEDSFPVTECANDTIEVLKIEGVKRDSNTKGSSDGEETVTSEQINIVSKDGNKCYTRNSTDKDQLKTPKLNLLASKLPEEEIKKIMAVTPRLSLGKEGDFIDLEETSTPSQNPGMDELIDRFVRHSNIKRKPAEKQQVNLNIVSKEDDGSGGKCLVSSNLQVTLDAEEELSSETVPGARFTFLKAALQARIREQREKQRLKRVQEKQFMETEEIPEDYQYEDNLPDEEAELTDQSDTDYETESEPEENDIPLIDKQRKKSCYMDDEAEEENEEGLDHDITDSENEACPASNSDDENDTSEAIKERKRIVEDPENESEEEERRNLTLNWEETQDVQPNSESAVISRSNTDELFPSLICKKGEFLDKDTSTASFDSSFELYGSVIAGHQPGGGTKLSAEKESLLSLTKNKSGSFSSTTSSSTMRQQELTLPAEDSFDIFNTEAISASQGLVLPFTCLDSTQPHESNKENDVMAKLQLDFSRIDGTQNKDDLIGLCSGQFTADQPADSSQMTDLCGDNVSPTQEMSELLGLCTGHFAGPKVGQSSPLKNTQGGPAMLPLTQDEPDEDELLGLCTSKFTMSDSQAESQPKVKEAKMTDKEKDERKDSPKMIVYSSDDENSVDVRSRPVRRQKRKRVLEFSDDEDAREPLAFDDEENEVPITVFTGFKDKTKGGIRADFLENEAELSGSDVNSEDEMEGSDDDMEEEEGDIEHFDSNELRNQVGKAHLKSLLDSDKREVRLLQELYLEDGELHGQGRSRQFRWKNLNKYIEEDERKILSDEEEGSDDNIDDSEWRQQKIEREKFLQEQRAKMTDTEAESFEVNSWPRVQNLTKGDSENRKPLPLASVVLQPTRTKPNFSLKLQRKRGSFLSRDKTTLARIAEFTKDRRDVVGGAKQGGNFVFQQLSAEEVHEEKLGEEKVEVSLKKRHSLPITKKAKVDISSKGSDNSRLSSVIFKYL